MEMRHGGTSKEGSESVPCVHAGRRSQAAGSFIQVSASFLGRCGCVQIQNAYESFFSRSSAGGEVSAWRGVGNRGHGCFALSKKG